MTCSWKRKLSEFGKFEKIWTNLIGKFLCFAIDDKKKSEWHPSPTQPNYFCIRPQRSWIRPIMAKRRVSNNHSTTLICSFNSNNRRRATTKLLTTIDHVRLRFFFQCDFLSHFILVAQSSFFDNEPEFYLVIPVVIHKILCAFWVNSFLIICLIPVFNLFQLIRSFLIGIRVVEKFYRPIQLFSIRRVNK